MIDFNYLKAKAQELFSKGVALVAKHAKVALLVLLGLLLLVLVQCAKAEDAPASNFGMIQGAQGMVFACYVSDEKKGPTVDVIHTCLILQDLGSGLYGTQGMVTFCGQTGLHSSGQPMFSCGLYNDIKEQMRGI
jgi:hypothetical protein